MFHRKNYMQKNVISISQKFQLPIIWNLMKKIANFVANEQPGFPHKWNMSI